MDSQDLFFQCAQDPLEGFTQHFEELKRQDALKAEASATSIKQSKEKTLKKKGAGILTKSCKRKVTDRVKKSYIISKEARHGHRLIQINIFDLSECCEKNNELTLDSENSSVSVQYVVLDPIDEILDLTENVINKISKQICNR